MYLWTKKPAEDGGAYFAFLNCVKKGCVRTKSSVSFSTLSYDEIEIAIKAYSSS